MDAERLLKLLERRAGSGLEQDQILFTGIKHDSVPRFLLMDPALTAAARNLWMVYRVVSEGGHRTQGARPSYEELTTNWGIGARATVAAADALLRLTRWLVVARGRGRDEGGRWQPAVILLGQQPIGLRDTLQLDPGYVEFVQRCTQHRSGHLRMMAEELLATLTEAEETSRELDATSEGLASEVALARGDGAERYFGLSPAALRRIRERRKEGQGRQPGSNSEPGRRPGSNSEQGSQPGSNSEQGTEPKPYVHDFTAVQGPLSTVGTVLEIRTGNGGRLNWPRGLDGNLRAQAETKLGQTNLAADRLQRIANVFADRMMQRNPAFGAVRHPMRFLETLIAKEADGELRGVEHQQAERTERGAGRDLRLATLRGDVEGLRRLISGAGNSPARAGLEKQLRRAEAALERALEEARGS